jgi:hypothetical protein
MADAGPDEGLLGLLAGLSSERDSAELAPPPPQPAAPQGRRVTPEELKTWAVIYACYLDPAVTVEKGRRLPLHKLTGCAFDGDFMGCSRQSATGQRLRWPLPPVLLQAPTPGRTTSPKPSAASASTRSY